MAAPLAPVRVPSPGAGDGGAGDRASLSGLLTVPGPAQTAALQPAFAGNKGHPGIPPGSLTEVGAAGGAVIRQ